MSAHTEAKLYLDAGRRHLRKITMLRMREACVSVTCHDDPVAMIMGVLQLVLEDGR